MKTLFIDLDGCVFKHPGNMNNITEDQEVLPNVHTKFSEWQSVGCTIIIATGRPESMRELTKKQLQINGLVYDQLVMGLKNYPRILINDQKPNGTNTAIGYCIDRNVGLGEIDL